VLLAAPRIYGHTLSAFSDVFASVIVGSALKLLRVLLSRDYAVVLRPSNASADDSDASPSGMLQIACTVRRRSLCTNVHNHPLDRAWEAVDWWSGWSANTSTSDDLTRDTRSHDALSHAALALLLLVSHQPQHSARAHILARRALLPLLDDDGAWRSAVDTIKRSPLDDASLLLFYTLCLNESFRAHVSARVDVHDVVRARVSFGRRACVRAHVRSRRWRRVCVHSTTH
jgi:hypothetical protein